MKRTYRHILPLIATVMLFGCQEPVDSSLSGEAGTPISFGVSHPTTRIAFDQESEGALNVKWLEGDNIGISAIRDGKAIGCNFPYMVDQPSADATSAKLAANSTLYMYRWADAASYTFYAYYPYAGVANEGVDYLAPVSLAETQTQTEAGSYAHLKDLWVMKAEPYEVSGAQSSIQLSFRGVYSIVELKLRYADGKSANRPIERLQLTAKSAPLSIRNANLILSSNAEADKSESPLIINDGVQSVSVELDTPLAIADDSTQSVWMVVAPGSHAAGDIGLQLSSVDSYRLDITIDDAVNFEPNKVYHKEIVINPDDFYFWKDPSAPAVEYYKRLTNINDLTDGEYIIGFEFKDESIDGRLLKLSPAARRVPSFSYNEANISWYADRGILTIDAGYVWTLKKSDTGEFEITTVDENGTTWLLNGANQAQGISIATTCSGHYDTPYANAWTVAVADTGEWYMQALSVAPLRYVMIDTVNEYQWRNAGEPTPSIGSMVFYKKVKE